MYTPGLATPHTHIRAQVYERKRFTDGGLAHHELYFPDGSCPPTDLMLRFLEIAEQVGGWCVDGV